MRRLLHCRHSLLAFFLGKAFANRLPTDLLWGWRGWASPEHLHPSCWLPSEPRRDCHLRIQTPEGFSARKSFERHLCDLGDREREEEEEEAWSSCL